VNDQSKSAEPKDQRVEAALRDYLERVDRGEAVDRKEFLSRHAEIADQLRSFIAAEDEVRKLAGVEPLSERSHNSTRSFAAHGQENIVPRSIVIGADSGETEVAGQFGRYRIIRALGKGAMGIVYLAEDTHIERHQSGHDRPSGFPQAPVTGKPNTAAGALMLERGRVDRGRAGAAADVLLTAGRTTKASFRVR